MKFRLRLFDLSQTVPLPVGCSTFLIDQSSPELSYQLSKEPRIPRSVDRSSAEGEEEEEWWYPRYRHAFSFCLSKEEERDEFSFTDGGWLKLGLRLSLTDIHQGSESEFCPLEEPRVGIELLMDKHIEKHVATEAATSIFAIPGSYVYLCPSTQPLKAVKEMVNSDPLRTESRKTWSVAD